MKIIKYQIMIEANNGTEEEPNIVQSFHDCEILCSEDTFDSNYTMALREAYKGEVVVEEIADEETEPTQLDMIEAQVTYTAMMTDTMLGV